MADPSGRAVGLGEEVQVEQLATTRRARWTVLALVCALCLVVGTFFVGRATAPASASPARYQQAHNDGYFDGLQAGEAQGRQEGRALQEGQELPASSRRPVKDAFNAGYAAGADDAFAGYDGGWSYAAPYVVTVAPGHGKIVYRIKDRDRIEPRTNYYLCHGNQLCHEPRP